MVWKKWVFKKLVRIGCPSLALVAIANGARGETCLTGMRPQVIFQWLFAAPEGQGGIQRGCQGLYNIPDITCDKSVRIVVLGDSIVAGVGDERFGNAGGGYVKRTGALLWGVVMTGVGTPGQDTSQLYQTVKSTLSGGAMRPRLRQTLLDADIIVLDIGRNDWWRVARREKPPVADSYARLRRLQRHLRDELTARTGRTPLVLLSRLLLPNRTGQGAWVGRLNARIAAGSSRYLPANLRFDLISKWFYNKDQLHPTAAGYDAIAAFFRDYFTNLVPKMWDDIRSESNS